MPDLASPEGQAELEPFLTGCKLLIIDNLSTLCRTGKENEAESWAAMQGWLLALRQRGTSRREDVLDTIISLKKPADFRAEEGARFEIVYEKARGFHGTDATSFEARLEIRDGVAVWSTQSLQEMELMRVAQLVRGGMSTREIEAATAISKSRVNRIMQKARDKGLLERWMLGQPPPPGGRWNQRAVSQLGQTPGQTVGQCRPVCPTVLVHRSGTAGRSYLATHHRPDRQVPNRKAAPIQHGNDGGSPALASPSPPPPHQPPDGANWLGAGLEDTILSL